MDKKTIILAALAVLAIANLISFFLMGHDKKRARQGKWRVSEKTLFLATACFGGLGGVDAVAVVVPRADHLEVLHHTLDMLRSVPVEWHRHAVFDSVVRMVFDGYSA